MSGKCPVCGAPISYGTCNYCGYRESQSPLSPNHPMAAHPGAYPGSSQAPYPAPSQNPFPAPSYIPSANPQTPFPQQPLPQPPNPQEFRNKANRKPLRMTENMPLYHYV